MESLGIGPEAMEVDNKAVGDALEAVRDDLEAIELYPETIDVD